MAAVEIADLIGPDLDHAVAVTGKEWERAYLYTPSAGLVAEFIGAELAVVGGELRCVLIPAAVGRPAFVFAPSTDGRTGVALQQAEQCDVWYEGDGEWMARCNDADGNWTGDDATGETPLEAICRAVLVSRVGNEVDPGQYPLDRLDNRI